LKLQELRYISSPFFLCMKIHPCLVLNGVPGALLQAVQEPAGGDCLEMICADFLAGANLQEGNPDALVLAVRRLVEMLPTGQREQVLQGAGTVP
jgi:hypothetical protein